MYPASTQAAAFRKRNLTVPHRGPASTQAGGNKQNSMFIMSAMVLSLESFMLSFMLSFMFLLES